MADDAEWVDVDHEFGVRPAPPRRIPSTTERPFWLTPGRPRPPVGGQTTTEVLYPWLPTSTPHTPHDAPEVLAPPAPGLQRSTEALAITMGLLGSLMGILLVGLLLYMLVLRRRLSEAKSAKAREDYSIRVTDVAHLSSALDDSSQLYANTSDLHRLMNSARMSRKNPPPLPPNAKGRPLPPPPGEAPEVVQVTPAPVTLRGGRKFQPAETVAGARDSVVSGFKRLSERIGNNISLPGLWNQSRKNEVHQKSTETVITMPEVVNAGVPEILDDDDLWSEDSFDSCSIGYEEDEPQAPSRAPSVRHSRRSVNRSRRAPKVSTAMKPSVPPPAPPSSEVIYGNSDAAAPFSFSHPTEKPLPAPPSNPKPSTPVQYQKPIPPTNPKPSPPSKPFATPIAKPAPPSGAKPVGVVRPAPPVPGFNNSGPSSLASDASSSGHNYDSIKAPPVIPSLPKSKPAPPSTPKPVAKPHLLPKLKIGLSVPSARSEINTPDTTTTLLSSTPCLEEGNKFVKTGQLNRPSGQSEDSGVDPSNLSVSARKALLEGKTFIGRN